MGYNTRFDAGGAVALSQDAIALDVLRDQQVFERARGIISTDYAEQFGGDIQGSEITGHIRRSTRHETLPIKLDYRNRRFRRNSSNVSPNELVQHQIPNHEQARFASFFKQSLTRFGERSFILLFPVRPKIR